MSWSQFRTLCEESVKLFVALELTADLPSQEVMDRWLGEPVKAVMVPTSVYLTNSKGFPVLSKKHQDYLKRLMRYNPQIVLAGDVGHEKGLSVYFQYFDFLWRQVQDSKTPVDAFVRGYEDYLQAPLQPLMDNLESGTYEVFEKDPVKYAEYERAVFRALLDRVPEDKKDEVVTVIMVVGAGRGPLVRASLRAAESAQRKVKMYAVEKNPNAVITLEDCQDTIWGDEVTVISGDMRDWDAPEKADILVSELLGSFGDNELSPECLDGAQLFLKEDGISIPSSSTSFIAPLQSSKLHSEVKNLKENLPHGPFDTPYVVYIHNANRIAEIQPLFVFEHPNKATKINNERYGHRQFKASEAALLHGVAGYFETVLYKDVKLSIHPNEASEGMFSWFPIFFPLEKPVPIKAGDVIDIHFWRKCDKHKVWYEWCISSPQPTTIRNPNARTYFIGL